MERIDKILESGRIRLLAFVFVSVVVVAPTYFLGVYDGPDIPQHFQFADTFERAILSGDLYPSWADHENLGYGSVGVRFYPPLFSFVLALAHIVTNNWHIALCLVFFCFSLMGTIGAYLLAKEFLTPHRAFWAGIVFALMPYHLNQIYNISVYAEFAGSSVLPFCYLFATRVCRRGALVDVIGLAGSYAILILTHLPSSVTGSLCLLIYGLVMISKGRAWSTLVKLAVASIGGLAASSAYWLRMVTELEWMQHTKFRDEQVFDYTYNFLLTSNFLDGSPYPFLDAVLITTVLIVLFALWGLYAAGEIDLLKHIRGPIALFSLSVFMTLKISQPLWEIFPFIQSIQFPFRWLTVAVTAGAVIIAGGIHPLYRLSLLSPRHQQSLKIPVAVLATCLSFVFSITWMNASYSVPSANFDEWVQKKTSSKGLDFWWTTITKKEAFDIKEKVIADQRQVTTYEWQPYDRRFAVDPGNASTARVATLYYPHWKAEVNGAPAEVRPDENGAILIPIPNERSVVSLRFQEPVLIKTATMISIATWLLLFIAFLSWTLRRHLSPSRLAPSFSERAYGIRTHTPGILDVTGSYE